MSKKLTFVVLSGPTREYIDPVRFITNESSGKMGAALAQEILKKKHEVIFITGKAEVLPPKASKVINVVSAKDMFEAAKKNFIKADIIISAAAISDFRVVSPKTHKIKKTSKYIEIKLTQNPDIIAYLGKHKKDQVVVGFALETQDLIKNARKKLKEKNLDLIVANTKESLGADKTSVHILKKDAQKIVIKNTSKERIAGKIIDETIKLFRNIKVGKTLS